MANKAINDLLKYGARKFVQPTLSTNGSYGDDFWVFRKGAASTFPYNGGQDAWAITDKNTSTFWNGSVWRTDSWDYVGFYSKYGLIIPSITMTNSYGPGGWQKNPIYIQLQYSNNTTDGTNGTWTNIGSQITNPSNTGGATLVLPVGNTTPIKSLRISTNGQYGITGDRDYAQIAEVTINNAIII